MLIKFNDFITEQSSYLISQRDFNEEVLASSRMTQYGVCTSVIGRLSLVPTRFKTVEGHLFFHVNNNEFLILLMR